jgi:hypothetical protein
MVDVVLMIRLVGSIVPVPAATNPSGNTTQTPQLNDLALTLFLHSAASSTAAVVALPSPMMITDYWHPASFQTCVVKRFSKQ